jgi:Aspartyl/Asparaginyl beta-hydroxylase
MEFDGNFSRYGRLDATALRACTDLQSEDAWRADPFRQENFAIHSDTETIYLIYDRDFRHVSPTMLPKFEEFSRAMQPFIDLISARFAHDGWVVRCVLAKLCAGGRIGLHEDLGLSLRSSRRIHIPIITNPNVKLTVGGESIHMQPGEIWEINNTRLHGAENPGPGYRVHLIVDWAQPLSAAVLESYFLENPSRRPQRGS